MSRKSPVQLLRSARLGVMSHVHADPGRNTNIAVAALGGYIEKIPVDDERAVQKFKLKVGCRYWVVP